MPPVPPEEITKAVEMVRAIVQGEMDALMEENRELKEQLQTYREVLNMCARSNHGKAIELGLSDRNFEDCGDPTCMEARKLLGDSHG